jgi:hypothetical protein
MQPVMVKVMQLLPRLTVGPRRQDPSAATRCVSSAQRLAPAAWLSKYYAMPATKKCYDNALLFWKDNSSRDKLPFLSQMAEIYFGISSSSVPVECLFPQPDLH